MLQEGFFSDKELDEISIGVKPKSSFAPGTPDCDACGLWKTCKSPKMKASGQGKKGILAIAEGPGAEEDKQGTQLVGDAGTFYRNKLAAHGIDLDRDCYRINAINCRPPDNRKPSSNELLCCKPMVDQAIKDLKPQFIWLLGGKAVEQWLMGRFKDKSISRWRGLCIPDLDYDAWVIPQFHPSYPMRFERDENLHTTFDRDLSFAISCLNRPHYTRFEHEQHVQVIYNADDIVSKLVEIKERKPKWIMHDYETTGLKPHRKGHQIACASIYMPEDDMSYAFPIQYLGHFAIEDQQEIIGHLVAILEDPDIGITSHNLKFEKSWSRNIFGAEPTNEIACTQVNSHICDNRARFSSLKEQVFMHWGIYGYDSEMLKYTKSTTKGGNAFNRIHDAPLSKLLLYCGLDSFLAGRLHLRQQETFEAIPCLGKASVFFTEGLKALADAEENGMHVDETYYNEEGKRLTAKVLELDKELLLGQEGMAFQRRYGRPLDLNGQNDLKALFYEVLKLPETRTEKSDRFPKGSLSLSQATIEQLDSDFARKLVVRRQTLKIRDTYLANFMRESVDGIMHPFFNLHIPVTFRGSASNPSFQNIPVRDEASKKSVRRGLKARRRHQILEVDYGGIEVCSAAFYSKDPVLMEYIGDPATDMHRDQAMLLFLLDSLQATKTIRFFAKNDFVFPELYGSYWRSCAKSLWNEVVIAGITTSEGITVRRHLANKGINTYEQFEAHVREEEKHFWERFHVFRKWQQETQNFYLQNGYVEMLTGFRCSGYMSFNDVINYRCQGTAFHLLLWSLIEINKILKRRKTLSQIIGQVHDSIVFDMHPSEQEFLLDLCQYIMCEKIRNVFPWINVPLTIEPEIAPIDGSWYEKEEIKLAA